MKTGIEFTVVWSDPHAINIRVTCSNGRFCGDATIYFSPDDLARITETLSGFPSHVGDSRKLELGTFNPDHADGGIRMHFYCRDSVGHAAVDVALRGDGCMALGEAESVALRINVEAGAIDSFLMQIRSMDADEIGATACLDMAR